MILFNTDESIFAGQFVSKAVYLWYACLILRDPIS